MFLRLDSDGRDSVFGESRSGSSGAGSSEIERLSDRVFLGDPYSPAPSASGTFEPYLHRVQGFHPLSLGDMPVSLPLVCPEATLSKTKTRFQALTDRIWRAFNRPQALAIRIWGDGGLGSDS